MFQKFVGDEFNLCPQAPYKTTLYNVNSTNIYFFDCENETFKVVWDDYEIISNDRITIWSYIFDENIYIMILDSTFTYKTICNNCTIEDVVTSFNEQLIPQIQKLYEPGGRRYLEAEQIIEKLT